MKKLSSILLGASLIFSVNSFGADISEKKISLLTLSNIKEVSAPSKNFTGDAKVKMLFSHDSTKLSAGVVNFKAGARTNWHTHPKGQMLVILDGKGWTQEENGKIIEFKKGDVVWIPANVKHWHGASQNSAMSHLAIAPEDENQKSTDWFEKVNDDQYKK